MVRVRIRVRFGVRFRVRVRVRPFSRSREVRLWTRPLLITNRKSHMGFPLVPKSVTLNDLQRRNGRLHCVISPNSVAFGPYYVKVVEDRPIHSASEM